MKGAASWSGWLTMIMPTWLCAWGMDGAALSLLPGEAARILLMVQGGVAAVPEAALGAGGLGGGVQVHSERGGQLRVCQAGEAADG